ncbi:MAG: hypothetical protein WC390_06435 [Sulfurimonas sp.]|jgi:hypothetical protein
MSKKYIAFSWFNEVELLELKLNQYYDFFDGIIISEGSKTQSNLSKPFFLEENKQKFKKYWDKIIHLQVKDGDWPEMDSTGWTNDVFQRNFLSTANNLINLQNDDIIGYEDADEICAKSELERHLPNLTDILVFSAPYHVYYLNLAVTGRQWNSTVFVRGSVAKQYTPQQIIKLRDNPPAKIVRYSPENIHAGYQFGMENVLNKYKSCVEPFDKINGIPVKEHFEQVWKESARPDGNFIFCDNLDNKSLHLSKIDDNRLPTMIQNKLPEWENWMWRE